MCCAGKTAWAVMELFSKNQPQRETPNSPGSSENQTHELVYTRIYYTISGERRRVGGVAVPDCQAEVILSFQMKQHLPGSKLRNGSREGQDS